MIHKPCAKSMPCKCLLAAGCWHSHRLKAGSHRQKPTGKQVVEARPRSASCGHGARQMLCWREQALNLKYGDSSHCHMASSHYFPVLLRGHGPVSFSLWFLLLPCSEQVWRNMCCLSGRGPYGKRRPLAHRGDAGLSNGTLSVFNHPRHGDKDWHMGYFLLRAQNPLPVKFCSHCPVFSLTSRTRDADVVKTPLPPAHLEGRPTRG